MRLPAEQSFHDKMTKSLADTFAGQALSVSADVAGYNRPPQIGNHIPDILASGGRGRIIVETETADTIDSSHTKSQFVTFASMAGAEFHVLVPKVILSRAQANARLWGVSVAKWWYYE